MGILKAIQELNKEYAEVSSERMKDLCTIAGVIYREPKEANKIIQDLKKKDLVVRVSKYTKPEEAVGQLLILRSNNGIFQAGYDVWIDFTDYTVKHRMITTEELEEVKVTN